MKINLLDAKYKLLFLFDIRYFFFIYDYDNNYLLFLSYYF